MGVTIHFEGHVRDAEAMKELLAFAEKFASQRGWRTEQIASPNVTLLRVRENEEKWDYTGPVSGMAIFITENCDPVRLEFDENFYVQEYTKTQFAGATTHAEVVRLLQAIMPFFESFKVDDEGEYWDLADLDILQQHFDGCERGIREELRKHPNADLQVKRNGRIIDLVIYE